MGAMLKHYQTHAKAHQHHDKLKDCFVYDANWFALQIYW